MRHEQNHRDYKRIIHSRRWHLLRESYITAHPMCEECLKRGIWDSRATEVHHVVPIGTGRTFAEKERLAFDADNLEALCHECHVRIHKEMAGRRRAAGHSEAVRSYLKDNFGL